MVTSTFTQLLSCGEEGEKNTILSLPFVKSKKEKKRGWGGGEGRGEENKYKQTKRNKARYINTAPTLFATRNGRGSVMALLSLVLQRVCDKSPVCSLAVATTSIPTPCGSAARVSPVTDLPCLRARPLEHEMGPPGGFCVGRVGSGRIWSVEMGFIFVSDKSSHSVVCFFKPW